MPLTFTPKISRSANMYFFIQNLSEWHMSNRKEHNKEWRSQLRFSTEAEACIKEFGQIHGQYTFGDKYLGRPFFIHDDPWIEIEKIVGEGNTYKIRRIFNILEPYFDIIFKEDEIALKKWEEIIEKKDFIENALYINNTLSNLYGCAPYAEHCTIYLLLSTKNKNGGTAGTISNSAITIELSRAAINTETHISNIIWHELIHLYFRNHTFYPLLKEYTNSNWEIMGIIDELLASSLLPNGLLKSNALGVITNSTVPNVFNARISSEIIFKIQQLIYQYLQDKRALDTELVKKLCALLDIKRGR